MKKSNPWLMQFKNLKENMEWHKKEKEKYQNYLLSLTKDKNTEVYKNDWFNKNVLKPDKFNFSNRITSVNSEIQKLLEEIDCK